MGKEDIMNDNHGNSARLRDRRDQPDLIERIAGQAARDLPEPPPLSASALARIATRIGERTSRPRRFRLGPVLVTASVLLCVVTVASAARMDLLPRWIVKMVGMESEPAKEEMPRPVKPRGAVKRGEEARVSGASGAESVAVEQEAQAEAEPKPEGGEVRKAEGEEPRRKLAMTSVGHGHVYGHDRDHVYGHSRVYGHDKDQRRADGIVGNREPSRLALKTAAPLLPSSSRPASESMVPAVVPERQSSALVPPAPSERPGPPAPVPAPASPVPAHASAPTRNLAARHLRDVVQALRVEHAPRTALDLLDRHAGELQGNAFAEEALLLRVEALLALRQQPEALRLLDGLSLANAASSSVLLVTRGQLRAGANRCAEAVADFDLALARTLRPSKQALLGRAQCKQRQGDAQGAQADLDRLRREFPGEPAP